MRYVVGRSGRIIIRTAIVALAFSSLPGARSAVAATSPHLCDGRWAIDPSVDPSPYSNLFGVDARSSSDVWAVGTTSSSSAGLIEHWNGIEWSLVSSPIPPERRIGYSLGSVDSVTSSDAWIVGQAFDRKTGDSTTLTEHWDGAGWKVIPSPNEGAFSDVLAGVSVISFSDVWAVGWTDYQRALIEHWNGSAWSVVPSPPIRFPSALGSVSAWSGDDVWTVGSYGTHRRYPQNNPLIEHWNGTAWRIARVPYDGFLESVSAIGPGDAWAVGTSVDRWDGRRWTEVESPQLSGLIGVSGSSSNDVWAVGNFQPGIHPGQVFSQHWDGSAWSLVAMRNPAHQGYDEINDVSAAGAEAWAVGRYVSADGILTLIEHVC